jgi:hypothetical protein
VGNERVVKISAILVLVLYFAAAVCLCGELFLGLYENSAFEWLALVLRVKIRGGAVLTEVFRDFP